VADNATAGLLTGTLNVIAIGGLRAVYGCPGQKTTEDADLGMRRSRAGHADRFEGQVVGNGILPLALADLWAQRYR